MRMSGSKGVRFLVVSMCLALVTVAMLSGPLGCSGKSKVQKLYEQGSLFHKHRKYYDAQEKFEAALEIQPDHVASLQKCSEAYLQTNKPEQAIAYARRVLELEGGDTNQAYLTIGQSHLLLATEPMRQGDPDASLDEGQLQQAQGIAAQLRQSDPAGIEGTLLQARIDFLSRRIDDAERLYRRVLENEPANSTARTGLIEILIAQREFEQAETFAREGLAMLEDEEQPPVYLVTELARALMLQERYDEAYEVLAPHLDGESETPQFAYHTTAGQVLLSEMTALRREKEIADGATTSTAVAARPADEIDAALDDVANRLAALGGSMKSYFPDHPESFFLRGLSYELLKEPKEATEHYRRAVSLAPSARRYRMALGLAYMSAEEWFKARQEFSTLMKSYPNDFEARLRTAQCLMAEGAEDSALTLLRDLRLENGSDERVRKLLAQALILSTDPRDVDEGFQLLETIVGSGDLSELDRMFVRAQVAIKEGTRLGQDDRVEESTLKLQAAERMLVEVARAQPDNLQARLLLSELAVRRRDLVTALLFAKDAAALDDHYLPRVASLYANLGQIDAARSIYQDLMQLNPGSIGYAMELVDLALREGDVDAAVARLDELAEQNPAEARLHLRRADILSREGRLDEAVASLESSLQTYPDDPGLTLALARILMGQGSVEDASQRLERTCELFETRIQQLRSEAADAEVIENQREGLGRLKLELSLAELLAGRVTDAVETAREAAQLTANVRTQASVVGGIASLMLQSLEDARRALADVKSGSDQPVSGYFMDAMLQAASGDKERASTRLEDAPGLNPATLQLFNQMIERQPVEKLAEAAGLIVLQVHLADMRLYAVPAVEIAEQLLQMMPDEPFVLTRKAEGLALKGETDAAMETYRALEAQMPEWDMVQVALADLCLPRARRAAAEGRAAESEQQYGLALQALDRALELNPDNGLAWTKKGLIHQTLRQTEEANRAYRRMIEIDPANLAAYNNLAWNLAEAGDYQAALEVGEKGLELAPEEPVIQDTVGWIEHRRGNADRAVDLLAKAALRMPNNPDVRFHLAQAYEAAGQPQEAIDQLKALMLATPGYDQIGEVRERLEQMIGAPASTAPLEGAAEAI